MGNNSNSGSRERSMFEKLYKRFEFNDGSGWRAFPRNVNRALRKEKVHTFTDALGNSYTVDLHVLKVSDNQLHKLFDVREVYFKCKKRKKCKRSTESLDRVMAESFAAEEERMQNDEAIARELAFPLGYHRSQECIIASLKERQDECFVRAFTQNEHACSRDSLLARTLQEEELREEQHWLQSEENRFLNSQHSQRPRRSAAQINSIIRRQERAEEAALHNFLEGRLSHENPPLGSFLREHRDSISLLLESRPSSDISSSGSLDQEMLNRFLNPDNPWAGLGAGELEIHESTALEVYKGKQGEPEDCCICQMPIKLGDEVRRLPCLHVFHAGEIASWLKINAVCPICKHPIDS